MKVAAIFQVLEHLNDFKQSAMAAICFSKLGQNFIAINIHCNSSVDIFVMNDIYRFM